MIQLEGVRVVLSSGSGRTEVLDGCDAVLPTDRRLVVLGRHGAGKSTLIRLLAGIAAPAAGEVRRHARVSFPVGFSAGLRPALRVRENLTYVARLYGADPGEVVRFVAEVADLEEVQDQTLRKLSPQARIRLAYALAYALPFDVYLVDNVTGFGDPAFRERCDAMLQARLEDAGLILATRHARTARIWGDCGAVLHEGRLEVFDDLEEALARFGRLGDPEPENLAAEEAEAVEAVEAL